MVKSVKGTIVNRTYRTINEVDNVWSLFKKIAQIGYCDIFNSQ